MSPSIALRSPVFLFYSSFAAGLLVIAGAVLVGLTHVLRLETGHARSAYRGWLVMVPLLLLGAFLGREATILCLTVVALLAFGEFARATDLGHDNVLCGVTCLGIVAVGMLSLLTNPGRFGLFMTLPILVTAAILAVPVIRNRGDGQLRPLALAIFGFIYFGWMFGHVTMLANSRDAYSYLGYLLIAVELNDVSAYVSGKWLGRHPLRSNLSPKKTWEGALGALAVSLLLPWVLRPLLPGFGAGDCVAVGLIVGIGGQVGDLVVSVIKRDLGLKDMGALIPGHGGILDRIDSLIYVAPLFFHYLRYCHGLDVCG
jgi:phosphatidate cytidylyltransferase